eukprot:sb/3474724/
MTHSRSRVISEPLYSILLRISVTNIPKLFLEVSVVREGIDKINLSPNRTYLVHVSGYQPISDQCFLIRSIPYQYNSWEGGINLNFWLDSAFIVSGTDRNKSTTNQNSLFKSRDWLSANQGPVFPDLPSGTSCRP